MSIKTFLARQSATDMAIVAAALAATAGVAWIAYKGVGGVARTASKGAVDAVAGVIVGTSEGLGIPATDDAECQRALAEGRYWDASFACPAGTFIKGVFL